MTHVTASYLDLASTVKHLHLDLETTSLFWAAHSVSVNKSIDEVTSESDFPSFRAPYSKYPLPESEAQSNDALHYSMACRTVVAAAKGGRLRSLDLTCEKVQEPFAMRNLVPAWVRVAISNANDFEGNYSQVDRNEEEFEVMRWICAAARLPRALAHASLWLPHPHSALARDSRLLTPKDIQLMLSHFKTCNFDDGTGRIMTELYLRWFEEDEKLAQRVSDAWNAVVKRGKAGMMRCKCSKCKSVGRDLF